MYGLLLDSIQKFLREKYGERYWENIRRRAKLKNHWFVTHEVYPDSVMKDLVEAAAAELGEDQDAVMRMFGRYFAENIGRYGYARLLRVLGRDLRDFLNGLDDLHEYLRFSYPKMRPPSFICENETPEGMILHYTTQRRGYLNYVIGQLETIGAIYGKTISVSILSEEIEASGTHFVLDLQFDNKEVLAQRHLSTQPVNFTIGGTVFLSIFPFCLLFDQQLVIAQVGNRLDEVLPGIIGKQFNDLFTLRRPQFGGGSTLTWEACCMHSNCMFELVSVKAVNRYTRSNTDNSSPGMEFSNPPPQLKLKGQMMRLPHEDNLMLFLCSPAMDSPEDLYESGIFINDLSMHDSSRDFILAGSQQNPELSLALSQEKIRSAQLEDSIQKTDQLLYQMIPKPIADQLRNGETPLNTCQVLPSVSVLFSDIVSFTPMCSRLRPMEVVCVLNAMYVAFDQLCEKHHVYKVETIGDAYMVISGAPVPTDHHVEFITDFAFSIIEAISKINDPSTSQSLKIRVGIHCGTVVAGVVGASILRYDVFGDTVNVAARMEATGEPMRVHVSEAIAEKLRGTKFILQERGKVEVKGKGLMTTFWVLGKNEEEVEQGKESLNPFQRQKQKPSLPVIQCPPLDEVMGPTHPSSSSSALPPTAQSPSELSSGLPPPTVRRKTSPFDWPQADRRLSHTSAEGVKNNSGAGTGPSVDLLVSENARPYNLAERRSSLAGIVSRPPPIPNGVPPPQAPPLASRNDSIVSDYCIGRLRDSLAQRNSSIVSDYNMARLRESLVLAPIHEDMHPHIAMLASLAEENARHAKALADELSQLAMKSMGTQLSHPPHKSSDDATRSSPLPHPLPVCPMMGTPVDAPRGEDDQGTATTRPNCMLM